MTLYIQADSRVLFCLLNVVGFLHDEGRQVLSGSCQPLAVLLVLIESSPKWLE